MHLQTVVVELEGQKRETVFGEKLPVSTLLDCKFSFSKFSCRRCMAIYTQHDQECFRSYVVLTPRILENL